MCDLQTWKKNDLQLSGEDVKPGKEDTMVKYSIPFEELY